MKKTIFLCCGSYTIADLITALCAQDFQKYWEKLENMFLPILSLHFCKKKQRSVKDISDVYAMFFIFFFSVFLYKSML